MNGSHDVRKLSVVLARIQPARHKQVAIGIHLHLKRQDQGAVHTTTRGTVIILNKVSDRRMVAT